jgi:hypothetical protein
MATINPRTLFQTFLNTPKPNAITTGANKSGSVAAQGVGMWQINARATFNGNANSVPVVTHLVKSHTLNSLVFPGFDDSVIWFDYATGAAIGVSTYASNQPQTSVAGITYYDWIIDSTKATALPNSNLTVNYTTNATVWTGTPATVSHRRAAAFAPTGAYDPYTVGAAFNPTSGVSMRLSASVATVAVNNILRLRYSLNTLLNGTSQGVTNYDFYFNVNTGFASADFPTRVLVRNTQTGVFTRQRTEMRWTRVSGF